jgi:predicted RNA-binding Zn-ribbon protein involved in translation (DUF1610 family)
VITEPKLVFDVGNDAFHLGSTQEEKLAEQVVAIRTALDQDADWDAFWSARHLELVEAIQKARYEQLLYEFESLASNAKEAYPQRISGLTPGERQHVIAELVACVPAIDDGQHLRAHPCPACGNTMWVICDVTREIEQDFSDAPHSVAYSVKKVGLVDSAACPVCGLQLDRADMIATDVPLQIEVRKMPPTTTWQSGSKPQASKGLER